LRKVAEYNKGNRFNYPYPNETFWNYSEIEKTLLLKYLKISKDIRKIEYCYKTNEFNPKYFVIDYPAYNFRYNNHRFFEVSESDEENIVKEFSINKFVRHKDGGTTIITVTDDNKVQHNFFSSKSLFENVLTAKFDEIELIEATDTEKEQLIEMIDLNVI